MMKKKLLSGIVASAFSMSLLTGIGIATASNQAFAVADYDASSITLTEEAIEQTTIATTTTQPTETTATTTATITVTISEQQAALDKLAKKEHRLFGEFQRERAIIRGDLAPDSDRLTLDEVNKIIRTSGSYDEICEKLKAVQPYADYYGGSGVSLVEYWFDDKGVERIVMILEQEDIFYSQCAEDGTLKEYQVLYPAEKQVTPENYQNMIIGSFMGSCRIYNGLGSSLSTTPSEGEPIGTQTTEPTQTTTTTTTVSQPIDEQQAALDKLAEKEKALFCEFQRERAIIRGDLAPDSDRLTLDEVNEIIRTSDSYDEICKKLREVQPYADYYGGSGVSFVEYWFDDKGIERIVMILEQEDIFYSQCAEDGTLKEYQVLYPAEKQVTPESYQNMIIGSFMGSCRIYNGLGSSLSTTPSEGEPIGTQTTEPTQTTTTTTTVSQPIDEQQAALDKLAEKEHILFGEFQRERAVISGELSSDAARLTLDEVNEIIRTSGSYDEICKKLRAVQPYADYFGGSGVSLVEYWFDDKGAQKIVLILEQEDIFYAQCTEDGFLNECQALRPVEKQMNLKNDKTKMIGSYMIYNDVDASGDVNGDGTVSVSDVIMLQKWLLAVPDTNLVNWKAADFCKDNKLDVFDLTLMKRALIGN